MYYIDSNVETLQRIFDQNSRKEYLRLDLNENPGGLSEEFTDHVLKEITPRLISEYPETIEFTEKLAEHLGCEFENICLVNGSAEGIRYIIEAFTSIGGKIVGVVPTYAMYEVYSKMYGRVFCPIPYTDKLLMPVQHILDAITQDTQLIVLTNPNNPMGNAYSRDEFIQIIDKAKRCEATLLVDEAYYYFYSETFIDIALQEENIFVTRTFSKLFSMAGLRLGYVVGWKRGIQMVQKMCTPHNVNAISMLFAEKILDTDGLIEELVEKHREGRAYLIEALKCAGYRYHGDYGNYIFIETKTDTAEVVQRMKDEKRILIKAYSGVGEYGECLRVTTAEVQYMKMFVEALLELDGEKEKND